MGAIYHRARPLSAEDFAGKADEIERWLLDSVIVASGGVLRILAFFRLPRLDLAIASA